MSYHDVSDELPAQTVLVGATVLTMDAENRVIRPGTIVIEGDEIADIFADGSAPPLPLAADRTIIDCKGMIAIPGLINGHTHCSEILLRGSGRPVEGLYDWQWNITYPCVRRYSPEDVYTACLLFSVDALLSGTTTLVDNANTARSIELAEAAVKAYQRAGIRAALARVVAVGPLIDGRLLEQAEMVQGGTAKLPPHEMLETPQKAFEELESLMVRFHWRDGNKTAVWPAPHKPNRTSPQSIIRCHMLAETYDAMVSQPCSETRAEAEVNGMPAIEFLQRIGALNHRTLLGHCTHIGDREVQQIVASGAQAVHLPVANLFLGSGIAPMPQLVDRGVAVGLGTDNANCNNTANMIREISICALLHRGATGGGATIAPRNVLAMATAAGARAIGQQGRLGSLEAGKQADVVLLDATRINMTPSHDAIETIVFQATGSEVDTVFVGGKMLVHKGQVTFLTRAEENELRREAQLRSAKLLAEDAR